MSNPDAFHNWLSHRWSRVSEWRAQVLVRRPETFYLSCVDMQSLRQEGLRVILLDTRFRRITAVDITKGTINESLAHPREILNPVLVHSAYAFVVVHNLWAATRKLCNLHRIVMRSDVAVMPAQSFIGFVPAELAAAYNYCAHQ